MSETVDTARPVAAATLPRGGVMRSVEKHELAVFAVGTLAAWAHTIDEIRIGEFIAVPFGIANVALLAGWPRFGRVSRAWTAIVFGLFWALAAIPYHVIPLLEGAATGQNISGLLRVVGGAAMILVGVEILRRPREADDLEPR